VGSVGHDRGRETMGGKITTYVVSVYPAPPHTIHLSHWIVTNGEESAWNWKLRIYTPTT
jgi:hypothetical protein